MNYPCLLKRLLRTGLQTILMFAAFGMAMAGTVRAQSSIPQDQQSAVIFTYHHIGDDLNPSANLPREKFAYHLEELKSGNYHVLSLGEIINDLKTGNKIPDPAVAVTFDGGHKATIDYAAPLLLKHGFPFTIFISTDALDNPARGSLTWDDVRKLARNNLVTIGLHPASYQRLYDKDKAEISRQLNKALSRYREELGREAEFFAYPFGEASAEYSALVERQGFKAAFGQQSGVAYAGADLFMLPRFSMTGSYGDLDRFQLTALALPLPVQDVSPRDPYIHDTTPEIGFTVDPALKNQIKAMSCFSSAAEKANLQIIAGNRVEIRLEKPFEDERGRINCTMPGPMDETREQPRWRWFGMMLTMPVTYPEYEPAADTETSDADASEDIGLSVE